MINNSIRKIMGIQQACVVGVIAFLGASLPSGCTDPSNNDDVPAAVAERVNQALDNGQLLVLEDYNVTYDFADGLAVHFPAGALDSDTSIDIYDVDSPGTLSYEIDGISHSAEYVHPVYFSSNTFDEPVTITFPLPSGSREGTVLGAFWDPTEGRFITVPCAVDPSGDTASVQVDHFSLLAVAIVYGVVMVGSFVAGTLIGDACIVNDWDCWDSSADTLEGIASEEDGEGHTVVEHAEPSALDDPPQNDGVNRVRRNRPTPTITPRRDPPFSKWDRPAITSPERTYSDGTDWVITSTAQPTITWDAPSFDNPTYHYFAKFAAGSTQLVEEMSTRERSVTFPVALPSEQPVRFYLWATDDEGNRTYADSILFRYTGDCIPDCDGRECGSDGCGATCGPGCSGGESCDPSTGRCQGGGGCDLTGGLIDLGDLPTPLNTVASQPRDGVLYLVGGAQVSSGATTPCMSNVWEYDLVADSVTDLGEILPYARCAQGAAEMAWADNGKLYISPGLGPTVNNGWGSHSCIIEFDPTGPTAVERACFPSTRWGLSVVNGGDGNLYFLGGWDGGSVTNIHRYEPATDTLTDTGATTGIAGNSMSAATSLHSDGNAYFFTNARASFGIYRFEPSTLALTLRATAENAPPQVWIGADGIIRGLASADTPWSVLVEFDPASGDVVHENLGANVFAGRRSGALGADTEGGHLYLFGGTPEGGDQPSSAVQRTACLP